MTMDTTGFRDAVARLCASVCRIGGSKTTHGRRWVQFITEPWRLWTLMKSYPRAVLTVCILIALATFLKAELRILRHGTPSWWTWFDQGRYLASAFALASGDLNPAKHHYPIGYALTAAPFTQLFRSDPFLIVNMLCLSGSLWAFVRLGEILGVARVVGAIIFLATSVFTHSILMYYVIPWTTTPTTFLILVGLMLCFLPPAYWRALLLGLIPGLIVLIKPVDAIALVPGGIYYAIVCLSATPPGATAQRAHTLRLFSMGVVGLVTGLAVAAFGHWLVDGWALSRYEAETTRGAVFILRSLPYKLYSLFVDPAVIYGNYLGTTGIFARYPWAFAGACGMILMLFRDLRLAILALCSAIYIAMYAAYYDMMPNSLWHFNSIHYYTWCFPIFGLFAFVLARRLLIRPSATDTIIVVLASVLLLAWRPVLRPVAATVAFDGKTAASIQIGDDKMPFVIDLDGTVGDNTKVYFGNVKVRWGGVELLPEHDTRAIPTERGARVLLMRPENGRTLIISWGDIDVSNVRRLELFKLNWTFL